MNTRRQAGRRRSRRARPPLGQHFLADERLRREILDLLDPRPEDCWLEIGAGNGEITLPLAATGGALTAVERDATLVESLREALKPFPRARVVSADVLQLSLPSLAGEMGCQRVRVYGNLPYYITSPILRLLFNAADVVADIHVLVQREVAERLVARPHGRDYGYLSVLTQYHAAPEVLRIVPAGAFRPPPRVESALVEMRLPGGGAKLGIEQPDRFLRFVGTCFHLKRKTLVNNLRGTVAAEQVQAVLAAMGLAPRARAEELSLTQFADLYRRLHSAGGVVPSSPV